MVFTISRGFRQKMYEENSSFCVKGNSSTTLVQFLHSITLPINISNLNNQDKSVSGHTFPAMLKRQVSNPSV